VFIQTPLNVTEEEGTVQVIDGGGREAANRGAKAAPKQQGAVRTWITGKGPKEKTKEKNYHQHSLLRGVKEKGDIRV